MSLRLRSYVALAALVFLVSCDGPDGDSVAAPKRVPQADNNDRVGEPCPLSKAEVADLIGTEVRPERSYFVHDGKTLMSGCVWESQDPRVRLQVEYVPQVSSAMQVVPQGDFQVRGADATSIVAIGNGAELRVDMGGVVVTTSLVRFGGSLVTRREIQLLRKMTSDVSLDVAARN